jgi:hypothetical protein
MSSAVKLADLLAAALEPPARVTPRQVSAVDRPGQVDLAVQVRRRRPPVFFAVRGRQVPR